MALCEVNIATTCRGLRFDETGLNIKSYTQRTEDPKEYVTDKDGSPTGFYHCFLKKQTGTIEGEIITAIDGVLGIVDFGTAMTLANPYDGYGVDAGDWFVDDVETSEAESENCTATVNISRHPGIVIAP